MRVGILTFHYADNPGAVLQAYGLQKAIESLGHSAEVIDFRYQPGFKLKLFLKKQMIQALAALRHDKRHDSASLFAREAYKTFRDRWIHSNEHIRVVEQLPAMVERLDAIVVGSDQVWNADFWSEPRWAYFLTFCKGKSVRRISYAPCFGQRDQPRWYLSRLNELIKDFDHLSVRGRFNWEILKRHTSKEPEIVVDPTLLCSFEDIMAAANNYKKYVLVYSQSRRVSAEFHKLGRVLKKEKGLSVVSLSSNAVYPFADHYAVDAGPSEFVRLVSDADFILTTSYHGTIFCLKYRKLFISYCRGERAVRITDLLEMCGITDRFVTSADEALAGGLLNAEINYGEVKRRIDSSVNKSMSFLKKALG